MLALTPSKSLIQILRSDFWDLQVSEDKTSSSSETETFDGSPSGTRRNRNVVPRSPQFPGHLSVSHQERVGSGPEAVAETVLGVKSVSHEPKRSDLTLAEEIRQYLRGTCSAEVPEVRMAAASELLASMPDNPEYQRTAESIIVTMEPLYPASVVATPIVNKIRSRARGNEPLRWVDLFGVTAGVLSVILSVETPRIAKA